MSWVSNRIMSWFLSINRTPVEFCDIVLSVDSRAEPDDLFRGKNDSLAGWQSSSHLYERDFTLPIVIETGRCIFFKLALIWMQIQQNYMLLGFWNLQPFFPWDLYLNTFQSYWQSWERFTVRQSSLVTCLPDPTSFTAMLPCTFGKLVLKCKKTNKKCCSLKAKRKVRGKEKKLIFVWNDWHFLGCFMVKE